jgi:mannose-6-phosphate isomerase-like protein (cupin superfamily)
MEKPFISFFKDKPEFWIQEGCMVTENLNSEQDSELSVARAVVPPGFTTAWHRLRNTTERYVIISGTARVEAGDYPATDLVPQDVVYIPAGVRQRITNTDPERPLVFLALCTPRFRPENYEALE